MTVFFPSESQKHMFLLFIPTADPNTAG